MLTGREPVSRSPVGVGFAPLAVRWFLGLSGLYVLYASATFLGLADDLRTVTRLGMLLGPTTTALSLLVAPAAFAAAATGWITGGRERRILRGQVTQLILLAVVAYALCGFGPWFSSAFLGLDGAPTSVRAVPQIVENARFLVPGTIAIFTVLSGVAGGLTSRVAESWKLGQRVVMRWLFCLALFLSFCLSFLLTTSLVLQNSIASAWILPGSLLLPTVLVAAVAWRSVSDLRPSGAFGPGRNKSSSYDPLYLDRVDRAVNPPAEGPEQPAIGAAAATQDELEMIHLAKGIRSAVGPDASLSPPRVDEIVNSLLDAPSAEATKPVVSGRARRRMGQPAPVGQFITNWVCLALGLVMAGTLGGVQPHLVLAGLIGLLGSVVVRTAPDRRLSMVR